MKSPFIQPRFDGRRFDEHTLPVEVALHRAVFLARVNPESRVLLTTFWDTLASALRTKLRRLISNAPRWPSDWKCMQ